jgi:hypothetical protein
MKRAMATLALLGLLASPTVAGSAAYVCTLIGCGEEVGVHLGDIRRFYVHAASLRLCVDRHCRTQPVRPHSESLNSRESVGDAHAPHRVVVFVLDKKRHVLLRAARVVWLRESHPNGLACEPTCFHVYLVLDARKARLREPAS